jgi:4-amino-4-deoxy-L-arabinose transferase-like glycosyltransferase
VIPRVTVALLILLWVVTLYRAATQSITTDEAFACNEFVDGSWDNLFNHYNAAHHVLFTILSKFSVTLFGLSEFTLRLPSVLGALLYLASAHRICRHIFGTKGSLFLGFGLLSLSPAVMDFMSVARGYGLSLALWSWAMWEMIKHGGESPAGWVYAPLLRCSIALSLAVGCQDKPG